MTDSTPKPLDLDAYFQRIGYSGDRSATLQTLQMIHQCHAQTIAFENLNSFLRQPVRLDLTSLQQKLIYEQRGGYCFEQNALLRAVLLALGFQVSSLAARVLLNIPEGTMMPRSHMLLQLEIDGEFYIADVGFGGLTLTAPLALAPHREQQTPHEPFRLLPTGSTYTLQAKMKEQWKSLYHFDLHEQQLPDYEVSNWYVSTHPDSLFVNSLIVARPDVDRRYGLRNTQLSTHYLDGRTEQRSLATVAELRSALETEFHLTLPAIATLDEALQRLLSSTSS